MAHVDDILLCYPGKEVTRVEYEARAKWEREMARLVRESALEYKEIYACSHDRTAEAYEAMAPERP